MHGTAIVIVANPDLWPVFYNDEHNEGQAATTAYQLKNLSEQRISMMHLLGDKLFELRHIKHDQKAYRLLDGCRELCYWIDERILQDSITRILTQ